MYQVDLCYTDNPLCLWIFYLVNIIPSSSKSLQAPSTKTHSFLRKSTAKVFHSKQLALRCLVRWGPLNPTSRWALGATSLIILRRTTSSLMTKKKPEEKAALELRANRRSGYDPNSSLDENNPSFLSGVGSSVSSTPSLERAIKKQKVHSDSD